ncbi:LppP/LprE family lipoprotein [Nocardia sp. alder85J]|uniref:LppP/LprE family lipoprotein n=1 Tax=Nocardia sp. alder85J TaxID=2862949 RepID=UPI001CD2B745|nr:LppP/LprE family lipoprotein [Nocardia sp. alder85J]MCX4091032.1 LppP/LprE family lipoprotein [Nocardia sp. alder85J]
MKRIAGVSIAAVALALLTACQDETSVPKSAGSASATTVAASAAPTSAVVRTPGSTPARAGAPATAGNGKCVDLTSPVVTAALGKIGESVGGRGFLASSGTDAPVGSCPALLWVLADTEGGTASSPWHVLLFDHAGFLGTATKHWTAYTQVVGSSDRSVRVQYRWLGASDPSCCPTGGPVVVTLTLGADGHTITPDRDFPPEVLDPK